MLREIRSAAEEPADFESFWRQTFQEAMNLPLQWTTTPVPKENPEYEVFKISYAGWVKNRIGGWLLKPRQQEINRGLVFSHGYGGRGVPEFKIPIKNAAVIFPCATGLPEHSLHPGIPSNSQQHVLYGISHRETYVHRFCVADIWRAASVLLEAVPEITGPLDYYGGSFGGGIGALALPWDRRFRRAYLAVPSFGNHPLRLQSPCTGSGEAVRRYAQEHPEVISVLNYFDAATAAKQIQIPTYCGLAAFDPSVPPAGQFSVFNALAGKKTSFVFTAGHFSYPDEVAEQHRVHQELIEFFK